MEGGNGDEKRCRLDPGAGDDVGHERHEEQQRQAPEHEAEDAVENPGNDAEEPPDSGGLGIVLRVHEIFDALHDWLLHEQNPGTFRVAGVLYHVNCGMWSVGGDGVERGGDCSMHVPLQVIPHDVRKRLCHIDGSLQRLVTQQRLPHLREDGVGGRGRGVLVLRAAGHRANVILVRHQCVANLVSQVHRHALTYCVASSWKWCCTCSGSARSVRKKSCRSSGMNPAATHISASSCGVVISTRDSTSTSSRPTGRLPWIHRLIVERSYPLRRDTSPWVHLRCRIRRYRTRPNSVIPVLLSAA